MIQKSFDFYTNETANLSSFDLGSENPFPCLICEFGSTERGNGIF